ncbi:MAG: hypothetical protein R3F35_08040 [Myxococcota bacterium]
MVAATAVHHSRDAVEVCLDRLVDSPHLRRSRRLCRFLRFVVEALLEGRSEEIKERTIGVEVYGRAFDYDPHSDPIVRSEAHRLRRRLATYYEQEGSADPIVIALPKGHYVPEIRVSEARPDRSPSTFRVSVGAFQSPKPDGRDRPAPIDGIEAALRDRLSTRSGLEVTPSRATATAGWSSESRTEPDFRVEGSMERQGERATVRARLVRVADGRCVWSGTESAAWTRAAAVRLADRLADPIATTLAGRAHRVNDTTTRARDAYAKGRHSSIRYGNAFDPRDLEAAERRLREALDYEPAYVDAIAELAHVALLRLFPPRDETTDILARARTLLDRALAIDPRHARSLYLLGSLESIALGPRPALRMTEFAVALDPHDSEGRSQLAARYASLGFWESAIASCDWATALDPVWDAPRRLRVYLLTRLDRLDAARREVEALTHSGVSGFDCAMARFDVHLAEGDLAGARASLARSGSDPDPEGIQEDRREIAVALVDALSGRHADARRILQDHLRDGPRFWDHLIRLALALGEGEHALELLRTNPINGNYRWLATEPLVRAHLRHPEWRTLADALHDDWRRDRTEFGPRLPAPPPILRSPEDLLRDERLELAAASRMVPVETHSGTP